MRKAVYNSNKLELLFQKQKTATIGELKEVLGTNVEMTIYRKLSELSYRTSYSHTGRYYTLDKIAEFDKEGLWSYKLVWFSMYGSLLETVKVFINKSDEGYSAKELKEIIHIEVKEPLLKLTRRGEIIREKISGTYIYFSSKINIRKRQELIRKERDWAIVSASPDIAMDELKAAIIIFYSLLDEKQKRLYAGLESIKMGHGGDTRISSLFDLDIHTVAKGRRELLSRDIESDRVRKRGGGRRHIKKHA